MMNIKFIETKDGFVQIRTEYFLNMMNEVYEDGYQEGIKKQPLPYVPYTPNYPNPTYNPVITCEYVKGDETNGRK